MDMNKNSSGQIKIGIILSYASLFVGLLVNLLYTPILLDKLDQSGYGVYTLAVSVTSYMSLFSFGLSSAYVHFYSQSCKRSKEAVACLNGVFIKSFSIIAIVVLVVGGVVALNASTLFRDKLSAVENEQLGVMIFILSASMAIDFLTSIFLVYITANERFVVLKGMSIVSTVLKPFFSLVLLEIGMKSIAVVIGTLVTAIIVDSFYVVYSVRKLEMHIKLKNIENIEFKNILKYSSYIFIIMIVDQINWNVDKILLGVIKGAVAVAVYGVAAQINTLFMSFSSAVSSIYVPRIHFIMAKKDDSSKRDLELSELLARVGSFQFVVLMLIYTGFCLVGKKFICIWAGEGYEEAYYVLILLLGGELLSLTLNLGIEIQRAKNMQKIPTIVAVVNAVINIVISIPLCYNFGVIGCSIGTAVVMVLGGIFKIVYYKVALGVNMSLYYKKVMQMFKGMIVPIVLALISIRWWYGDGMTYVISFVIVYTFIYIISVFFISFTKEERKGLIDAFRFFIKRKRDA